MGQQTRPGKQRAAGADLRRAVAYVHAAALLQGCISVQRDTRYLL